MKKLRPRLTFANVVSCLALFVALGGSAYAATQLPKNSVGTKQLKDGAVTEAKLAKGVIGMAGANGERGPEGRQGPAGPQGIPGAAGAPGATHVVVRHGFGDNRGVAECAPGEVATGGGEELHSEEEGVEVFDSRPVQDAGETPTAWEAEGATPSIVTPAELDVYVICVSP
jgi:hypothetical protein